MKRNKPVEYREKTYNLDTLEVNAIETAAVMGFSSFGAQGMHGGPPSVNSAYVVDNARQSRKDETYLSI